MPKKKARKTSSHDELTQVRADAGRKGAATRKLRSEDIIVAAALKLAAEGTKVTQVAVLAAVKDAGVTAVKTVARHWKTVTLELQKRAGNRTVTEVYVKKDPSIFSAQIERSSSSESIPTSPQASPSKSSGFVPVPLRPRLPVPAFLVRKPPSPVAANTVPEPNLPVPDPDYPHVPF